MGDVSECVHCQATIVRGWVSWHHAASDERRCRGLKSVATPAPDLRGDDQILQHLKHLAKMRRDLEADELATVTQARAAGIVWHDIGDALGVTRQTAHQKYADKVRERT